MKRPRRLFRNRPAPPAIPPGVDRLRDARKAIPPWQTYRVELPDGRTLAATGAELIRDADAILALVDAQRGGDEAGMRRAVGRIARAGDARRRPTPARPATATGPGHDHDLCEDQ